MTALGVIATAIALTAATQAPAPTRTALGDLTTRPDLVGKPIQVEGRQPRFTFHREAGWDEFKLLNSPVRFRLPRKLAYPVPPNYQAARVRGTLKQEGGEVVVEVASIEELPADIDRLAAEVAKLAPDDVKGRDAWARWAEAQASLYEDEPLREAARKLAGQVVRVQAANQGDANPEQQLTLAQDARDRQVPEPGPSALAHRGFRTLLARTRTPAEAEKLADRIAAFFPEARTPAPAVPLRDWLAPYQADPAEGYRRADPPARATFDRLLLADAVEKALTLRLAADPRAGLVLARKAQQELPDRPEVASRFRQRGLDAAEADLGSLRLADVQELARAYREELSQPERATALLRSWLDDQRKHRLSAGDAEGRLLLAEQYEKLVGDQATAVALLKEAWKLDPGSRETTAAFRQRGYRQVGEDWVASASAARPPAPEASPAPEVRGPRIDPYKGLTREEIRSQIGKPKTVARVATQGQVIEQWTYEPDLSGKALHINFLVRPDQPRATVISADRVPVAPTKPLR